jgi:transporter family-2 protein
VQGFGILLIALIVGLAAGGLLGVQPSVNGQLGLSLNHPLQAALISFGTGTALLTVLCLMFGVFPPNFRITPAELPWWIWFGGAIGVVMVTTSLVFVPRIGSLFWFAAVMTGQIVAALLLDHFGLLGNPKANASPLRLLGAGLMIASVLVVVYAKHSEANSGRQDRPAEATSVPSPDRGE